VRSGSSLLRSLCLPMRFLDLVRPAVSYAYSVFERSGQRLPSGKHVKQQIEF
jgi:hypothetical protein